jgi:AGCS family alanine or glycine:cation symporter
VVFITAFIEKMASAIWSVPLIALFLVCGLFFSFKIKWFQIFGAKKWLKETVFAAVKTKKKNNGQTGQAGELSPFQAMTTSLAATIGTGNIVSVATAIAAGGAGAVFWMWVSAVIAMALSFAENSLASKYRYKQGGTWRGGPMAYMEKGVGSKKLAKLFAVCCVMMSLFGAGNMTQANSVASALNLGLGIKPVFVWLGLSVVIAFTLLGGAKRVGKITEKIVPYMAVSYFVLGFIVILLNFKSVPLVFTSIFKSAFGIRQAVGGAMGYGFAVALRYGVARGVFSNEAGMGTTTFSRIYSGEKNNTTNGMWGIFEVFVDTILLCTITALCILTSGISLNSANGAELAAISFSTVFGKYGEVIISLAIVVFALTSMLGWSFYGNEALIYLTGRNFKWLYAAVYVVFIYLGCMADIRLAWALADIVNAVMAVPNLLSLLILQKEVGNIKNCKSGTIKPA